MHRTISQYGRKLPSQSFKCNRCHTVVSFDPFFSKVKNRNHCPYCLWSKHVDLYKPGDRLSACKAAMQPVGLTLKRIFKKYGGLATGELMLIHRCVDCGKVSINRIAADDDPQTVLEIFFGSWGMNASASEMPGADDVHVLSCAEEELVRRRLFGTGAASLRGVY
jgi:DNA-directed RNA polymerase subunit RPC12/RpoP